MTISDSQLMDKWADAARRTGTSVHINYPSVAVLREFYLAAYDEGHTEGFFDGRDDNDA